MAELNGETPIEGSYQKHFINQLGEDDEYDSDESVSNVYESVREHARDLFKTTADHVPSPRSVRLSPTWEFLFPLVLVTI